MEKEEEDGFSWCLMLHVRCRLVRIASFVPLRGAVASFLLLRLSISVTCMSAVFVMIPDLSISITSVFVVVFVVMLLVLAVDLSAVLLIVLIVVL